MASIPLVFTGDYNILLDALDNGDLKKFRNALHTINEAEKRKIFEMVCRKPGSAQFIDECISAGCDVNGEVDRRPIVFAAECYCAENLAALLKYSNVDVDAVYSSFKLTPLHALTENLTDGNFSRIVPCIKLLVQNGGSMDLPDWQDRTPISLISTNPRLSIANQEVILRSLQMPNNIQINDEWDFIRLFFSLKKNREDEFLDGLKYAAKSKKLLQGVFTASVDTETLLTVAAHENLVVALEKMIQLGADVNLVVDARGQVLSSPAQSACDRGHWKSLDLLLKTPKLDLNGAPLLHSVVAHYRNEATEHIDYGKCLEMLLNHPHIDINLQGGAYKHTALHCAILSNKPTAVAELLKRGAYIGSRDVWGGFTISRIDSYVLEKHLNSCITPNDLQKNDSSFRIEFDFKNLVPVPSTQKAPQRTKNTVDDVMSTIEYMSQSIELRHLTMHPLIASFLCLKWKGMAPFVYANFLLCLVYATLTVLYILLYYNYHEQNTVMRVIIILLSMHITLRELLQLKCMPSIYLRNLENYFEWSMIVLVWLVLSNVGSDTWRRSFAASSILLVAIEVFLLAGSLPFWSFCTHYVMLKTVIWSFLRSLSQYAIIPLAFSLAFFTLLHQPSDGSSGPSDNNDDDGHFNKFSSLGMSIIKTLVMFTGEFDASDINLKTNIFNYIVFIIFVFIIVIVLLNLLNGLAVHDTKIIKSKAELTNFIGCVQVMTCYERYLAVCSPVYLRLFPFSVYIQKFEELKSVNRITVTPNNDNYPNRIVILSPQVMRYDSGIFLDPKIVKVTFEVLEKKKQEQHDIEEKDRLHGRMTKMEHALEKIAEKLDEIFRIIEEETTEM